MAKIVQYNELFGCDVVCDEQGFYVEPDELVVTKTGEYTGKVDGRVVIGFRIYHRGLFDYVYYTVDSIEEVAHADNQ